ncbi:MAG: hypothetical protein D6765_10190 [Bacteroidetes bacterium]|nr:MAG: hypothetical protein D6765_10190 [Bacteroidota bacterium]
MYEPAPVQFLPREAGHLPYATHPGAVLESTPALLWWTFTQQEPTHFFSRWYEQERAYLEEAGVRLMSPREENLLLNLHRRRPLLSVEERLLLVLPERLEGRAVQPHPLLGDLGAAFESLAPITHTLQSPAPTEAEARQGAMARHFRLPEPHRLEPQPLPRPRPYLEIPQVAGFAREKETPSSLEALVYYPYQWVFRHRLQLQKATVLSVVEERTLLGNLAHRLFELLLQEEELWQAEKPTLDAYVDEVAQRLLAQEGAVLLLYGREPDRVAFVRRLQYAAWSLLSTLRDNGWSVAGIEREVEGTFAGLQVRGRADLLLQRNEELAVVDLKWRGESYRRELLRNNEDIQLSLYAYLLRPSLENVHSAYFIMQNGRWLARNRLAFHEAQALAPDEDHRALMSQLLERLQRTLRWRRSQLDRGWVEVRCQQTAPLLDDFYANHPDDGFHPLDLLEMKSEDAPFDDFRTLIHLIE